MTANNIDQVFPRGDTADKENPGNLMADPLNKVLYPREYFIDENNPENNYVRGVTHLGHDVVAYLRLKESDVASISEDNAKTQPSILDFSETRPNARRKCFASPDNGPDKPKGVLLIEQVDPMEDAPEAFPKEVFVARARWMSILQEQDYNPATIGPGYVEVGFSPRIDPETKKQMARYHMLHQKFLNPPEGEHVLNIQTELEAMQRDIISQRKKFITIVNVKPEQTISVNLGQDLGGTYQDRVNKFKDLLREPLVSATQKGQYGGAIVRLRRGNAISGRVFDVINMMYDAKSGEPKEFEEVMKTFFKFGNKDLIKAISSSSNGQNPKTATTLEIVPCVRTNLGQRSYPRYEADLMKLTDSKILKTYVEEKDHRLFGIEDLSKRGAYLYSLMAVRNAEAVARGRGNILGSSFHSFSSPIANSLLINKENLNLTLKTPAEPAPARNRQAQEPSPQ